MTPQTAEASCATRLAAELRADPDHVQARQSGEWATPASSTLTIRVPSRIISIVYSVTAEGEQNASELCSSRPRSHRRCRPAKELSMATRAYGADGSRGGGGGAGRGGGGYGRDGGGNRGGFDYGGHERSERSRRAATGGRGIAKPRKTPSLKNRLRSVKRLLNNPVRSAGDSVVGEPRTPQCKRQ